MNAVPHAGFPAELGAIDVGAISSAALNLPQLLHTMAQLHRLAAQTGGMTPDSHRAMEALLNTAAARVQRALDAINEVLGERKQADMQWRGQTRRAAKGEDEA